MVWGHVMSENLKKWLHLLTSSGVSSLKELLADQHIQQRFKSIQGFGES